MGKNPKNAKNSTRKSSSKKSKSSGDKLAKEVLAVTEANIARIEAAERGETPPSTAPEVAPVEAPKKPKVHAPKADKPKKEKPAKKPSLLDHAVEILKKSKEPLTCKEIVEKVMATSDWKTNGKTPWATLYSAVIREIAEKKSDSRFKKMDRGMFSFNG